VKTLYVRDEDAAMWEAAAQAASQEGASLSEFVTAAVRARLDDRRSVMNFELLSADSLEPFVRGTAIRRTFQFEGRWILKEVRSSDPGASPDDVWSIAVTKAGAFAAHVLRRGEAPLLGTDPDIEELQRKFLIPPDVVEAALAVLKEQGWVVRRDL
jgi:hypothetical protein